MKQKYFTIALLAFKPNGKYYSEYTLEGSLQYLNEDEDCPYLPDVIDLVNEAKLGSVIPKEFDYVIQTGVPHLIKAN